MIVQKVLIISTKKPNLRSEAIGWDRVEDPSLCIPNKHIGLTKSSKDFYTYDCVLRAMSDGWKLLAPPTKNAISIEEMNTQIDYEWWLVKDKEL